MIKASCVWGDGEDVLVTLENHSFILYEAPDDFDHAVHGLVKAGSFFLTASEARELATNLLLAARAADELEEICKEHDKEIERD